MRSRKRAVFSVWAYRPDRFSTGRLVPHFVDALVGEGWRVDVLTSFPYYPSWRLDRSLGATTVEHGGAVRVHRFAPYVPRRHTVWTRGLHELSLAREVTRRLPALARGADLVVVCSPPALAAAGAARIARAQRARCIALAYDLVADLASDVFGLGGRIAALPLATLEPRLMKDADRVIALSETMAQRIGRWVPSSSIRIIRTWADDELFEPEQDGGAAAFRRRLGIGGERALVGFAGSFARKQHLPEIVAALSRFGHELTTVFVGDGLEREAMGESARSRPCDVRFVDPLPASDLHAFLRACDLSIVPAWTRHAGSLFPSKVANILAAGCPILAITHPDNELARWIEDEGIGVVCASLDPEAIVASVRRALEGDAERRQRCRRLAGDRLRRADAMRRFLAEVRDLTG